MTTSEPHKTSESAAVRVPANNYELDLPFIMRQIRLCRATFGAVLEELECKELDLGALEHIGECSTSVTAEIERLWEFVKQTH